MLYPALYGKTRLIRDVVFPVRIQKYITLYLSCNFHVFDQVQYFHEKLSLSYLYFTGNKWTYLFGMPMLLQNQQSYPYHSELWANIVLQDGQIVEITMCKHSARYHSLGCSHDPDEIGLHQALVTRILHSEQNMKFTISNDDIEMTRKTVHYGSHTFSKHNLGKETNKSSEPLSLSWLVITSSTIRGTKLLIHSRTLTT